MLHNFFSVFFPPSIHLMRLLGVRFFHPEVSGFFEKALLETIKLRKKENMVCYYVLIFLPEEKK